MTTSIYKYKGRKPSISVHFHLEKSLLRNVSLGLSPKGFTSSSNEPLPENLSTWLESYLEGSPASLESVKGLLQLPPFTQKVLHYLLSIPFGEVMSYQDVAKALDHPRAARAVGQSCGRNPFPLLIPCHRVISASGSLGGFSLDHQIKKELLAFENIHY